MTLSPISSRSVFVMEMPAPTNGGQIFQNLMSFDFQFIFVSMNQSPRDLHLETGKVDTSLPFTYRHRPVDKPKLLVLFLHGYTDHGGSLLRRLFPEGWTPALAEVAILAPNGPFPTPVKSETGWREAYAWYFYDPEADKMIVSPDTATKGCLDLISKFGYEDTPKVIAAFSQGGYLAPHLAQRFKNVKEIIGMATGFREVYYPKNAPWTVTAIHGSKDEVFPVDQSRNEHAKILKMGFPGEFIEIPGLAHVASADVGRAIDMRVRTWLKP